MLKDVLQHIGLSADEAKVYLASLKLGTQDIGVLSKEAKLTRNDTVAILHKLLDKGFVSRFSHQKDFYTPEHPKVLAKILENDHSKLGQALKSFHQTLPQFEEYMRPGFTRPEIAFYEGKYGLIAAYEDTLTSKTEIMAITSIDDTENILGDYVRTYYKRRKTAGIHISAIFPDTPLSRKRQAKDAVELRTSRLLPRELIELHIELNIYDDKVAYFSISEQLAVIVKSKMISDAMRSIFKLCWGMASEPGKKN